MEDIYDDRDVTVGANPNPVIWYGQIGYSARNLQDYKNSYPAFYIYGAEAINNQMVIVGWGSDGSGYRAFMLTLP